MGSGNVKKNWDQSWGSSLSPSSMEVGVDCSRDDSIF